MPFVNRHVASVRCDLNFGVLLSGRFFCGVIYAVLWVQCSVSTAYTCCLNLIKFFTLIMYIGSERSQWESQIYPLPNPKERPIDHKLYTGDNVVDLTWINQYGVIGVKGYGSAGG